MLVGDMVADMAGTLAHMPRRLMFEEDTMVLLFAVGVVTSLLDTRSATRAIQGAHIMLLAAVTGEVIGHIRTADIRGTAWAIMAWAMAILTMAIHTMVITHIILTDTDTGPI